MSAAIRGNLADRINIAAQKILRGQTDGRSFSDCFEMGDGDEVVIGLVRRAEKNPKLAERLEAVIARPSLERARGAI